MINQINFTGNLDKTGNTTMIFALEEIKENYFFISKVNELKSATQNETRIILTDL